MTPVIAPMQDDVCPHCHQETTRHAFITPEGEMIETHHCKAHGDVVSLRRVVTTPHPSELDWSAA